MRPQRKSLSRAVSGIAFVTLGLAKCMTPTTQDLGVMLVGCLELAIGAAVLALWRHRWPAWVLLAACLALSVFALFSSETPCRCLAGIVDQSSKGLRLLVAGGIGCVATLAVDFADLRLLCSRWWPIERA